jgi:molecular chaperone HtpG
MTDENTATTHRFEAEVAEVLRLVIRSLYSNKEIFLRELLSNGSDALDKLRFRAVTEPELIEGDPRLHIELIPDAAAGTLTLRDNGIGMTREQLQKELGTVAHSGTRAFLEQLEEAKRKDVSLIGQFGVGFYSGYLVADRVEVVSRAAGTREAHRWSSDGSETFSIEPASRVTQGTDVTLHLKADCKEYLDPFQLRHLVRKYSDFLDHPIDLVDEKKEPETLNEGKAIWARKPADVTEEQYTQFYEHLSRDFEPPLAHRHFQVEGTQMFSGLLYVPKHRPFDLFSPDSRHGVRLYVKRVLIMESCEELLPRWLRFIRGVVDSEDLPLNVSREILQDSRAVRVIRKQVVKHVLDLLDELSQKPEDYDTFWKAFGAVLKEGLHFEPDQKDRLASLLRYESTAGESLTSLEAYVGRMKDGQEAIYYVTGESRAGLEKSPHLEALRTRGWEVLLMSDPVDPFALDGLHEFAGKKLVDAAAADLDLGKADGDAKPEGGDLDDLRQLMRHRLQDQVSEVRVSRRLTDSPVCLVTPSGGLAPHLERVLRAANQDAPKTKRVLEINPGHPIVKNLETLRQKTPDDEKIGEWVDLLFEQALLAEGSPLEDPARFAQRLTALLTEASSVRAG